MDDAENFCLSEPAAGSIVGNLGFGDVTVEQPTLLFLVGRSAGETNVFIFDDQGKVIVEYDLVAFAESLQHVTVSIATELFSTFSCDPWCIEVENSSDIERFRQFADNDEDEDDFRGQLSAATDKSGAGIS